ncbi:hypothetical protein ACLKA7_001279 [Drosophila subpalustris]
MPGSSRVVVLLESLGSITGVVAAASAPGTGPPGACWARLPVVLVSCVREDCRDESCDRKDVFPLDSLSRRPLKLVLATARRIRRTKGFRPRPRSYILSPAYSQNCLKLRILVTTGIADIILAAARIDAGSLLPQDLMC